MNARFGAFALSFLVFCWAVTWVSARGEEEAAATNLPINKIVMFSSGVGYFEHNGDVNGDARIDLRFKVEDINDVLKSMVLQDQGGGRISTVTYESKDPITKTLSTFAIDLTREPTLAELLKQIRGEKVQVEAPTVIVGKILGVERRKVKVKDDQVLEEDYLTLRTDEGLRSIALPNVTRLKLLDDKLNGELDKALEILALGHSKDKKTATLNFRGEGKRPVRVGYIQNAPIWKTSYRLVLNHKEAPFLQGWAIVENTTEEDWQDVDLTLVSGRPISFVMNLYDPLYVQRPVVEPELYASLRPQTYGQDMAAADREFSSAQNKGLARELRDRNAPVPSAAPPASLRAGDGNDSFFARQGQEAGAEFKPAEGVQSVAQAGDVGELFRYVIATPVTLPRHQSAMLPIVNDSVKGEKVSIYNQSVQAKHPLNGLRLTNSTSLHLMQGPITVFDSGVYAGDARIEDLQPGTERLISYALDLDTEIAPEEKARPQQLVSVRIVKGTLYTSHKQTREKKYTVKNSGDETKKVLIEQGVNADWKLTQPKEPAEKTRDLYRFAVTAEPGKPASLTVQEENVISQGIALTTLDTNTIIYYMNTDVISSEVKNSLAEIVKRKQALDAIVTKRQQFQQQIQVVEQEQNRIRQNMQQLDRNGDLYSRYVKKFGEQEDQVETLRRQIQQLIDEENTARKSLDEFLADLNLD